LTFSQKIEKKENFLWSTLNIHISIIQVAHSLVECKTNLQL
jgi:hypothetical protein